LPHTTSNEPRWRRRPAERPSEILDAALEVFAESGLAGARVEDIAARAGISKGTVYLYFTGKEDLFREAIRDRVARTVEGLAAAGSAKLAPERLRGFIHAYWMHLRRPHFASMYRLIMAELHNFPELTRFYADEVSGKVSRVLAALIEQGVESGHFRDVEPLAASRMIVSLLVQHAVWASRRELFTHVGDRSDAALVAEIEEFVWHALGGREDAHGRLPESP
jgi:AcrR family transcriptional regulator